MVGGREGELGRERRLVGPGETQSSREKREGLWDGETHKGEWGGHRGGLGTTRAMGGFMEERGGLWDWEKHGQEVGARV